MANNYVYILDGKAYVNLTNKCGNRCSFCIRNTGSDVAGTPLWLDSEPSADETIAAFNELLPEIESNEVVFCGFGEPTENMDALKAFAAYLKSHGYATRLNTNGLGSLANGRDITSELSDIDTVSVSLNAPDAQSYLDITNSAYGLDAFPAVVDFAVKCKTRGKKTVFTVVDTIGEEKIAKCKALCENLGISLRVREYIDNNYNIK